MGRGLIADPEWVNKVQFGNTDDINRCISCNNGCTATLGDEPIRCSINPALVSGSLYKDKKFKKSHATLLLLVVVLPVLKLHVQLLKLDVQLF